MADSGAFNLSRPPLPGIQFIEELLEKAERFLASLPPGQRNEDLEGWCVSFRLLDEVVAFKPRVRWAAWSMGA